MNLTKLLLQVVSRGSATIGVADEDVVPLPRDHLQICRIKDENELAFTKIVQECQKLSLDIAARSRCTCSVK